MGSGVRDQQLLDLMAVRATLVAFRDGVRRHAGLLNRWNVYPVPDGDTGTNMTRTLDATITAMEAAPLEVAATCAAISHGSLMGARGNSGVILSQLMRGFAQSLASTDLAAGVTARQFSVALVAAADSAYGAVVRPKEGTILTVAREAGRAAVAEVEAHSDVTPVELIRTVRTAARDALARTPQQLPALAEAGVVDAGAAGFVLLFDAALQVLTGEDMVDLEELGDVDLDLVTAVPVQSAPGEASVADLRYEVMFFLDLVDTAADGFKQAWAQVGDSIAVVGGDGLWNCHIHTNDIGAAIETALDVGGRPRQIRVTDLFEEMDHVDPPVGTDGVRVDGPDSAVVAVANGDGLVALLSQLGVAEVVTGGQTMNPSTAELVDAVRSVVARTGARSVVLLPNNANIVPVALQVDALVDVDVAVVPTRSVVEALSALVVFDPSQPASSAAAGMAVVASGVRTGEVTCAVRDASTPAGAVRAGDWIGLASSDGSKEGIVAIASTLAEVVVQLADHVIAGDCELVTVLAGADAPPEVSELLKTWLAEHRPEVSVDWHAGGQPLYPYLFGAE